MTSPILLIIAVALGGLGVFFAMPRGRAHAGRAALVPLAAAAAIGVLLSVNSVSAGSSGGWFVALSLIALAAGIRVITHTQPVYSALYFVLVVVAVAGLLVLMQAEFLAAALVIIYAGAILVTYVFVIMLAQQEREATYDRQAREPFMATVAGFVLLGVIGAQLFGNVAAPTLSAAEAASIQAEQSAGNVTAVGTQLLTRYAVGVELAGVLLLASMVGAIAIAQRRPEDIAQEQT